MRTERSLVKSIAFIAFSLDNQDRYAPSSLSGGLLSLPLSLSLSPFPSFALFFSGLLILNAASTFTLVRRGETK